MFSCATREDIIISHYLILLGTNKKWLLKHSLWPRLLSSSSSLGFAYSRIMIPVFCFVPSNSVGIRLHQAFVVLVIGLKIYVWVFCLHKCMCIICILVPVRIRRGHKIPLEFQWFWATTMWVLRTKTKPSVRTWTSNCWAISPASCHW